MHSQTGTFRRTRDRSWWSWSNTVVVVLLLTGTIVSFTLPALFHDPSLSGLNVSLAVRGLVGLVLLFNVYSLWQQFRIKDLCVEIQEQEATSEILYRSSIFDSLTGLYNRGFAEARTGVELSRCHKKHTTLTLALFDLDRFKQINDTYGHLAGDTVLRAFAEHLTREIDGSGLAARLGGDEFMLLLPGRTGHQVQPMLERGVHFSVEIEGKKIPMKASVGWKEYAEGQSFEELYRAVFWLSRKWRGDVIR